MTDDFEEDQGKNSLREIFQRFLRDSHSYFRTDSGLTVNQRPCGHRLALIHLNMPEIDGLTLLEKIKQINPMMRSIMLSGYWDISNTRAAMNSGAFDTLSKPIDLNELGIIIKKALEEVKRNKETAMNENLILKQKASGLEIP